MSGLDEQINLVSKIMKGEIDRSGVEQELNRISAEYGDDSFNSYTVKRMPKPWTDKELKDLEVLSATGAASKEFYLYMAEVSEAVYAKKILKKIIMIGAGTFILILLVIVSIVVF